MAGSDFSDGDLLEEVFAIKLGTAENAQKFKDAFEAAQKEMARIMAGEDAAAGAAEADEAAAAIASLDRRTVGIGGPAPEPAAGPRRDRRPSARAAFLSRGPPRARGVLQ